VNTGHDQIKHFIQNLSKTTKSIHETAKLVARKIAGECKSHGGQVFKGVTLDF